MSERRCDILRLGALKLPGEARDRLAARLLESLESEASAAPSREAAQRESKWAALARRYRENPCLRGNSEEVNALIREFREGFEISSSRAQR